MSSKGGVLKFFRKKKNQKKSGELSWGLTFSDYLLGLLLAAITGIMPLVVRYARRPMPPELVRIFDMEYYHDLFSYWKGIALVVPTVIILIYVITELATAGKMPDVKKYFRLPQIYLSLGFLVFVFLSALLSDYSYTSWLGTRERGEGALMWLVYITVFFAAFFYVRNMKHVWFVVGGLVFSSVLMGVVGVSQLIGNDFFESETAFNLMLMGSAFRDEIISLDPKFEIAYGTLYNPNTFGKYSAMLSSFLLIFAATYRGKPYLNLLFAVAGILMFVGVIASGSLGGFAGIFGAASMLFLVLVCRVLVNRKELKIAKRSAVIFASSFIAAVLVFGFLAVNVYALESRIDILVARINASINPEAHALMFDYRVHRNELSVYRDGERVMSLVVKSPDETQLVSVFDGSGQEIPYAERTGIMVSDFAGTRYVFNVPGYRRISLDHFGQTIHLNMGAVNPLLLELRNNFLIGVTRYGEVFDISTPVPAWGFYGREAWGTMRGYIWSRSFPLLPGTALLGTGPDTFVNVFPQRDVLGKLRAYNDPLVIVDKAHNIFIQTWITSGGISALLLFGMFGHFAFVTAKDLVKEKMPTSLYGLRLGILCGVSAFVLSGMATDSTVGSTGVFFVILGVGYALCEKSFRKGSSYHGSRQHKAASKNPV